MLTLSGECDHHIGFDTLGLKPWQSSPVGRGEDMTQHCTALTRLAVPFTTTPESSDMFAGRPDAEDRSAAIACTTLMNLC